MSLDEKTNIKFINDEIENRVCEILKHTYFDKFHQKKLDDWDYEEFYETFFDKIKPGYEFNRFKIFYDEFKDFIFDFGCYYTRLVFYNFGDFKAPKKDIVILKEKYEYIKSLIDSLLKNKSKVKYLSQYFSNITDYVVDEPETVNIDFRKEIMVGGSPFSKYMNDIIEILGSDEGEYIPRDLLKDILLLFHNMYFVLTSCEYFYIVLALKKKYCMDPEEDEDKNRFIVQSILNTLLSNTNNGYIHKKINLDDMEFSLFDEWFDIVYDNEKLIDFILEKYLMN